MLNIREIEKERKCTNTLITGISTYDVKTINCFARLITQYALLLTVDVDGLDSSRYYDSFICIQAHSRDRSQDGLY